MSAVQNRLRKLEWTKGAGRNRTHIVVMPYGQDIDAGIAAAGIQPTPGDLTIVIHRFSDDSPPRALSSTLN